MKRAVVLIMLAALGSEARPADDAATGYWLRCHAPGLFPDPRDCRVFWQCGRQAEGGSGRSWPALGAGRCGPGELAYHPLHQNCSLPEDHPTCATGPVSKCSEPGQAGPVPLHPGLFYRCEAPGQSPQLFRCPQEQAFSAERRRCLPQGEMLEKSQTRQDIWWPEYFTTETTEEPDTTEEPTTTEGPTATEEPTTTEGPTATEEPTTTEGPTATPPPDPPIRPPPPPRPGNHSGLTNVQCSHCSVNVFNIFPEKFDISLPNSGNSFQGLKLQ